MHVSSQWNSDIGLLNLAADDANDLHSLDSDEHTVCFHLISDETSSLSLAGENLLVNSWPQLGAVRTDNGHMFSVAVPSDNDALVGAAVGLSKDSVRVFGPNEPPPADLPQDGGGWCRPRRPTAWCTGFWRQNLVALEGTVTQQEQQPWQVRTAGK